MVVLSNNDGCIVARSAEARSLGIAMGTPYFKAKQELERHNVVVRSSNYALYADMSQRLMSLLESQVEALEVYSIDEAFACVSRPEGDLEDRFEYGTIRMRHVLYLCHATRRARRLPARARAGRGTHASPGSSS